MATAPDALNPISSTVGPGCAEAPTVLVVSADVAGRAKLAALISAAIRPSQLIVAESLLEGCHYPNVELAVVDLATPDAAESLCRCNWRTHHRTARLAVLFDEYTERILHLACAAGATGIFLKDASDELLADRLMEVATGSWVMPDIDFPSRMRAGRVLFMPDSRPVYLRQAPSVKSQLLFDAEQRAVRIDQTRISLSGLEHRVLGYLAASADRPVSKAELIKKVWGRSSHATGSAQIKNCVKRIRQKIEPDRKHPRYLVTVRMQGYQLRHWCETDEARPADVDADYPPPSPGRR